MQPTKPSSSHIGWMAHNSIIVDWYTTPHCLFCVFMIFLRVFFFLFPLCFPLLFFSLIHKFVRVLALFPLLFFFPPPPPQLGYSSTIVYGYVMGQGCHFFVSQEFSDLFMTADELAFRHQHHKVIPCFLSSWWVS